VAAFSLATADAARPVEFQALLAALYESAPGVYDGEPACTLAGGHFLLGGDPADLLLAFLPPVVPLRGEHEKAAMRWSLENMRNELRDEKLGGSFLVQQLANKAAVLVNRVNVFWGLDWEARPEFLDETTLRNRDRGADIVISCVDTRAARHTIEKVVTATSPVATGSTWGTMPRVGSMGSLHQTSKIVRLYFEFVADRSYAGLTDRA